MSAQPNKIRSALKRFASELEKSAAEGSPDRMTVADGQGGVSTSAGSVPKDPGEEEVKNDQPTDGNTNQSAGEPAGGPDRMTVADGQGGVSAAPGSVPSDSGESDVKSEQPMDGDTRKSAGISARAARIRNLLNGQPNTAAHDGQNKSAQTNPTQAQHARTPAPDFPVDDDVLRKIASDVVSTEEGVQFLYNMYEKQAGEKGAREQILGAIEASKAYDEREIIKQASYDDLVEKVAAIHGAMDQQGVTEEDADYILKTAAQHATNLESLEHPLEKQAYAAGMDDAAMLASADEAAGMEGVPPVDEAIPMGGEEMGEEDILMLLQAMLESGEISEEEIIAALGGAEGAAPEEAAMAE